MYWTVFGIAGRVRHAFRWRWRKLRGMTGEFDAPEDSDRCRALTETWQGRWPDAGPFGHVLSWVHRNRHVRFHSLPQSKRYADSPEEHAEVVLRQRQILTDLLDGASIDQLVVIAEDWGARDLSTGWSKQRLAGAWPWWHIVDDEEGEAFMWARDGLTEVHLDALLVAAADDEAEVVIGPPGLEWLFCPYDGGVDVILPDITARDALRDRHPEWLPAFVSGPRRDYESGELDEDPSCSAYLNRLERIRLEASDSVLELIEINLHDAIVRDWQFDGREFRWSLVIGDLQVGYELATIVYHQALLVGVTPAALLEFDLRESEHELVDDEIDYADYGGEGFEQRFDFHPGFAFGIRFMDVDIHREPLAERGA